MVSYREDRSRTPKAKGSMPKNDKVSDNPLNPWVCNQYCYPDVHVNAHLHAHKKRAAIEMIAALYFFGTVALSLH
jgi:hypothetical protein